MITFDPSVPIWLLVLLFVPATAFMLWTEWRRKLRFRTLRFVAVFTLMLMLAAIFLQPYNNVIKTDRTLLLTPGYTSQLIDSMIKKHPGMRVMHTPGTEPYKDSQALNSFFELTDLQGSIHFVAGEGLPLHALTLLNKKNFAFVSGRRPYGIIDLSSAKQTTVNRQSTITGTFRNTSDTTSILLIGPGGKEDSVTIASNGTTSFDLSFTPRQTGKQLYTIAVKGGQGNVHEEKFPIVVDDFSPLAVLVVLSYPTFETTFLKNFIGAKGNKLVMRSQLSRNNFGYEYVNHQPLKFSTLTKSIIDEFDLLIADRATLDGLSRQESIALKQSVHDGLGLLPIYDRAPKGKTENSFFPFRTVSAKGDTTTISGKSKRYTLPVLPFRVLSEAPLQAVLRNESGILSGYTLSGKGKIGFQLVQQTFRLMLAGDSITYGNLWSPLLERIARSHDRSASVEFTNPFPYYVDEPIHLKLISAGDSPTLMEDSVRIPLREDVMLDDVWHATIWPSTAGWHSLQIGDRTMDYYVSKATEWRSMAVENQMNENDLSGDQAHVVSELSEKKRIPPLLFYAILLLAAGFLWLAPKL
ncbi:MAG TPA: hypothetical protein VF141_16495 [Chryseolinea sp.]